MSKIAVIIGHAVSYEFFEDGTNTRLIDESNMEHIGTLLTEGYVDGELHQADDETEEEIRGWWKKL